MVAVVVGVGVVVAVGIAVVVAVGVGVVVAVVVAVVVGVGVGVGMSDRTQQARERAEITIVVCPECGQDDRVRTLKVGARHYTWGKRCDGLPEAITYVRADRVAALETALREACHIAGCLDSLLAGVEDAETLEECKQAANVWMRRIRSIDPALAGGGGQTETPQEQDALIALDDVHEYQCGCDRPGHRDACVAKPQQAFAALAPKCDCRNRDGSASLVDIEGCPVHGGNQ